MKRLSIAGFALLIVAVAFSPVLAGHHYKGYSHGCMGSSWNLDEMDANQDQTLTFEEYSSRFNQQLRMGFDMIDADKDGVISSDEWEAFLIVHGVKEAS